MKEFLFLGDSITDCGHSFDIENLGDGYVRILAEELGHFSGNVKIKNMGVDGFTISALARLWSLRCKVMAPDFITILIGINDVAVMKCNNERPEIALQIFRNKYETLIEQIQKNANCPIMLMEPFIFPYPAEFQSWEDEFHVMSRIIRDIAQKYELKFVPLWDKLLDFAQEKGFKEITTDGVHLTTKGHRIIADAWMEYFLS